METNSNGGGLSLKEDFNIKDEDFSGKKNEPNKPVEKVEPQGNSTNPPTETVEEKAEKEFISKLSNEDKATFDSLKTPEEKTKFLNDLSIAQPAALELDGVKYLLDKDGNAVDSEGKIVKTKVEVDEIEAAQLEEPLIEEISKKAGYQPKDENGKIKTYEDTTEGIIEYTNDVALIKAQEMQDKFFKNFPDIKDYSDFRLRGGSPEDYFKKQSTSWSATKLNLDDKVQLTNAIVTSMVKGGISEATAKLTAKMYEDTDKLKEFGQEAYNSLVKEEKQKDLQDKELYKQNLIKQEQEQEQYWNDTNEVIKKGKLHSINIPDAEKQKFFEFIALAVDDNGNSQKDLVKSKLTKEQRLELDYLIYKGFDISKLVATAVKQDRVSNLRDRVKRQTGLGGGEGNKGKIANPNTLDISLDSLMK